MFAWGRRDARGISTVEFALVFPIIFALMFGIVQYSLYFWGRQTAAASAREAARQMAVGTDWTCVQAQAVTKAEQAGKNVTVTLAYGSASMTQAMGAPIEVTVTMDTIAPDFLPLPDSGAITEVAEQRVQNIPSSPLSC